MRRASAAAGHGEGASAGYHCRAEPPDPYTEIWQACAGRLFYIPRVGEEVFYFPQGHIEQVQLYANRDDIMQMPVYNLSSRILCSVANIQLQADTETDEVFAQITLLPLSEQEEATTGDSESVSSIIPRARVRFFSKTLTASDICTHGGFTLPKRHADECLPPLDMSKDPPVQGLVMKDIHGFEWTFRQIYRGRPKRHLFTRGWSRFVVGKKLHEGDTVIYFRGFNGELRIGIRRSMQSLITASRSVVSSHTMQHGILANAAHAVSSGTMFTVYCHPWTCPSSFIVPFQKYVKSMEKDYRIGSRFRMLFENEQCIEQRLTGTIMGDEDIDPIRWPGSKWRCLKVKWDSPSTTSQRPERISPWDIELLWVPKRKQVSVDQPPKRLGLRSSLLPGSSSGRNDRGWVSSVPQPETDSEISQDQENISVAVPESAEPKPALDPNLVPPHSAGQQNEGSTVQSPGETKEELGITGDEPKDDHNNAKPACPDGPSKFTLFGVDIVDNPTELPSPQVTNNGEPPPSPSSVQCISDTSGDSDSRLATIKGECWNPSVAISGYSVPVIKYGTSGRKLVDLGEFEAFNQLIHELDVMFGFRGGLIDGTSGWQVTYIDEDGDEVLMGDCLYQEFLLVAQSLIICPKD